MNEELVHQLLLDTAFLKGRIASLMFEFVKPENYDYINPDFVRFYNEGYFFQMNLTKFNREKK